MIRTIFVFSLLLVSTSVFSQTKFMAGLSVNPNVSFDINGHNYSHQSKPGLSFGAGANVGMYLGKRILLLTAIEGTGTYYRLADNSPYRARAWDAPFFFNYFITNKNKRVSLFATAGIFNGWMTYVNGSYFSTNTPHGIPYSGILASFGCKINMSERYSLLVIPDYYFLNHPKRAELRTMLVYNFGKENK